VPLELTDDQARLLAVLFPQLNELELEQVEDAGASVRSLPAPAPRRRRAADVGRSQRGRTTGTGVACMTCPAAAARWWSSWRSAGSGATCLHAW
jgi:hypothetical protein